MLVEVTVQVLPDMVIHGETLVIRTFVTSCLVCTSSLKITSKNITWATAFAFTVCALHNIKLGLTRRFFFRSGSVKENKQSMKIYLFSKILVLNTTIKLSSKPFEVLKGIVYFATEVYNDRYQTPVNCD